MTNRNALLACGALTVAAVAYGLVLYPLLPDRIPIHWNWRGEVDGYADKIWGVTIMPGMMGLFVLLLRVLPQISPGSFRTERFQGTYNYLMVVSTALLGYLHVLMLQAALHPHLDMSRWLLGGIFLFTGLLGNVLGKTRRNFWMGIRTPWTLASETVWIGTHRMAGRLLVGASILGIAGLVVGIPPTACFVLLMAAFLLPTVYSYVLYKQL